MALWHRDHVASSARRLDEWSSAALEIGRRRITKNMAANKPMKLTHLAQDLASGEWHRRYGDILEKSELDLGYRLVINV